MESKTQKNKPLSVALRALIEIGFIVFLFYSNLLMGEYDKTGNGQHKSLAWALGDIFTEGNFIIGYLVFEFLRKKFN